MDVQKRVLTHKKGGFTGSFSGLDLLNLVQICALTGVSGRLSVRCGSKFGYIYLQEGQIVHAVCEEDEGLEGFTRLIGWQEGEVQLEPDIPTPSRSIDLPWEGLLIRAMANLDEEAQSSLSVEQSPQAAEVLRLQRLYVEVISWPGLGNFIIYDRKAKEMVRPTASTQQLNKWANSLGEISKRVELLRALCGGQDPFMISVVMDGIHWLLIPHEDYLFALQTQKGIDADGLYRKVKSALVRYS